MANYPRYEVVETIASGDFATVSRARDRELGREVAIKQIHQHFLADERQLARYWQEAQLLASLQHPNILTIYDLVRSQGWLILELMRGSMKQVAQGEPIDLDFLRLALACSLNALHFLHTNGIVHGDVKPSNLLIDNQNRVKLGDFGLARRAMSEEGSLLKGTTKYMAPELLSNQFGAVGPASDLYSLGFTAYELMCGSQFEALFPGLSNFGRDQQIAWMMWHAAPDRHLPEVGRVLQGVPEDLARVIQRMATKDQARRYQSALDALRDLRTDRMMAGMLTEASADDLAQATQRRRRKRLLVMGGTFLASLLAVIALVFFMPPPPKKKAPPAAGPTHFIIRDVFPDEQRLTVENEETGKREPLALRNKDRFFVNGKETRVFSDLHSGDSVVKDEHIDAAKGRWIELKAFRPEIHTGKIKEIKVDEGRFTLAVTEGEDQGKTRDISIPTSLRILFNGEPQIAKKITSKVSEDKIVKQPVTLADLQVDDRVVVGDIGEETGLRATEISVQRVVPLEGVIRNIDEAKKEFTIALGEGDNPETITLPCAPQCTVTLNGRNIMDQQLLKPADLKVGDKVKVQHDMQITRIDADRVLGQAGKIQSVDYAAKQLIVTLEGDKQGTFHVGPACTLTLGGEPAEVDDLRAGDTVEIKLDRADVPLPEATAVVARRPADAARWALLIGNQGYDDASLTPLTTPAGDVKLLADAFTKRYGTPQEQTLLLTDEPLVRLQEAIPSLLGRVPAEGKLLVYLGGHAYKDEESKLVYYAPKDFKFKEAATTGLPLQWLLDQLEACPAKEKLLLLDCTQSGLGADLKMEPSAAEMLQSLKGPPGFAALRTLTAVASCKPGQRGGVLSARHHSVFAWCVAQAYSGRADKERSNHIEPTALFSYLPDAMNAAGAEAKLTTAQTPELFLPNNQPPRLSEDAKKAIRKMATLLRQEKLTKEQVAEVYEAAGTAAGKEIEPRLLYALLMLKQKEPTEKERKERADNVIKLCQEISAEHAELALPAQLMAWVQFEKHRYQTSTDELAQMVSKIPPPKNPADPYPELTQRIFRWAGQLREFASMVPANQRPPSEDSLKALDAAVAERGADALRAYDQGREKTRGIAADYDNRINEAEAAGNKPTAAKFTVERRQLSNYVTYPFDDGAKSVLSTVDQ